MTFDRLPPRDDPRWEHGPIDDVLRPLTSEYICPERDEKHAQSAGGRAAQVVFWARKAKERAIEAKIVCSVPGCGKRLYHKNQSSVCRTHRHRQGYCRCVKCAGEQHGA